MDVALALDTLRAEDRELALDAEGAFDWLTAGEVVGVITQIGLQEFLWYRLPVKFLTDDDHKRRVAAALGRLLELLDLPRYAAICTSEQTVAVLAANENDDYGRGWAAYRAAMTVSGVEPVDVDDLAWGGVMGVEEAAAYYSAAASLELSIVAGDFTPGSRGWKKTQQAIVREQLVRPRRELDDASLLDRVLAERIDGWCGAYGRPRQELVDPLRSQLQGPNALPDDVQHHVAPVQRLLQRAALGIPLTQTHRLKPATVVELAQEFGWDDAIGS